MWSCDYDPHKNDAVHCMTSNNTACIVEVFCLISYFKHHKRKAFGQQQAHNKLFGREEKNKIE